MYTVEQLNEVIKKYFDDNGINGNPDELYTPINYILSLGGKRVRPLMLLMSYNLFSDDIEKALPLAHAIEIFHNFTLIHDDIMDKAPLRRGKDTVHKKWNENIAILSGDAMLIKSYSILECLPGDLLKNILPIFNKTAIEVCEGQQYDMNFETIEDVSISEYIKMITLKTSVLLGLAMEMGALAAGTNIANAKKLYDFGKYLGIAFQLQDDYLDLYGDSNKFGKKIGGDIIENKKTFLTIKAFLKADEEQEKTLKHILASSPKSLEEEDIKIKSVKNIFDNLDITHEVKQEINKYYILAKETLKSLELDVNKKNTLSLFSELLISRNV